MPCSICGLFLAGGGNALIASEPSHQHACGIDGLGGHQLGSWKPEHGCGHHVPCGCDLTSAAGLSDD